MSDRAPGGIVLSNLSRALGWARAQSLWYVSTGSGCCADEVLDALGCRYDLERFGAVPQVNPEQADLLIISGAISYKSLPHLRELYDSMRSPKYVMAVGSCANCGGAFGPAYSYATVPGADRAIPIDVHVPGCPPRPEAIMNGLILLQDKIRGHQRTHSEA